jgi:hypothetical protein
LMIVVGSLLHATFFVLADRLLRPPPASPAPRTRTSSAAAVRGCACKMHFPTGHFLDRLPRQARDKDRTGTANCIIIAPKRLKLRLSGSARKSQKQFRDTPRFKFQAVLARTQPFYHAA